MKIAKTEEEIFFTICMENLKKMELRTDAGLGVGFKPRAEGAAGRPRAEGAAGRPAGRPLLRK